jgi:hypothetical protein
VGVEGKDRLSGQVTLYDSAHCAVAVFDGEREIALLGGPAHALEFTDRHTASEHQAFGSPADT